MEHRGKFFQGGVTFCALKPVRSIPARVVCLLGINDQVFPRLPQCDTISTSWLDRHVRATRLLVRTIAIPFLGNVFCPRRS